MVAHQKKLIQVQLLQNKFTPIRKVFLSKNKKGTRAFNNLDQEIENELFHHKYGDTNATQMKYNVSYSPVRN
ncbi:unnamed protein product [Plasmodium vivax]|uniref:(malaria parasite P. vivax) hypothetical protein n=1 Tax=Plasmodium vivax TaxID=5855 RepID=A0A8S4H937_PLAVI|nr:unnamed protein product [Plasmodium vivax]